MRKRQSFHFGNFGTYSAFGESTRRFRDFLRDDRFDPQLALGASGTHVSYAPPHSVPGQDQRDGCRQVLEEVEANPLARRAKKILISDQVGSAPSGAATACERALI